jgi:SAM-dependent methyltransferase
LSAPAFVDHFSTHSAGYARSRPTYPDIVFERLARLAPGRARAWDCATGSGQAAIGLARHFGQVEATDASAQQIANAIAAPNVTYSVQPAEATRFPDASFDAVCVAQALHWFDFARFYAEVRRVLRPGGLLLVLGYDRSNVDPAFDREFDRVVLAALAPFWPKQNKLLWDAYRDVPFPFAGVDFPKPDIELAWTLDDYLGYVATWSAVRKRQESDAAFLARARVELAPAWGPEGARRVTMPLHVLCGRHDK